MSLIQQKIDSLLNGVSQRPQEQRLPSQAEEQKNGLSHPVRGLMKRPPFTFVSKLASSTVSGDTVSPDYGDTFFHPVNRDETEKYHVVIANGDIQVFDAITGEELTVLGLDDDTYLVDPDGSGFRAATAGDTTIIVNRGVIAKQGQEKTAPRGYDSLIYIRQADYGTTYKVTLSGTTVGIQTIAGATAEARPDISTEAVAADLLTALRSEASLGNFGFSIFGSTILIQNLLQQDYSLKVEDGLADQGLRAVKGSVQAFEDLPRRAPDGFVVEIAGDPNSNLDNYWVKFDDEGGPDKQGVWIECPAPGTIIDMDPETLPHRLVRQGQLLPLTAHVGLKDAPQVELLNISGVSEINWQKLEPSEVSVSSAGEDILIRDNNAGESFVLDRTYTQLAFSYTMDMSLVEPGNDVTVTLYKNDTPIQFQVYKSGRITQEKSARQLQLEAQIAQVRQSIATLEARLATVTNTLFRTVIQAQINQLRTQLDGLLAALAQELVGSGDIIVDTGVGSGPGRFVVYTTTDVSGNQVPAGVAMDEFKIVMTYLAGDMTGILRMWRRARMTLAPVQGIAAPAIQITFEDDFSYPPGTTVDITINGNSYTYTVGATAETGADVATGVNTVLQSEGSITSTNTVSARVLISNTNGEIPELTVFVGLDSNKIFANPDLTLVANVFAGYTLRNVTDGSEGIVDTNTGTTITLLGQGPSNDVFLSGGVENIFRPGDLCTIVGTGRYFVFEQCPWKKRGCGDLKVTPFPSFIDRKLADVAFYQNRLVFVSDDHVICSGSGDLFNFFRFTGAQILPSDVIDVQSAHREVALFHSLSLWNSGLYAISESAVFPVTGEPVLTPTTIRIDVAGHVQNKKGPAPCPQGNRLYLSREKGGFSIIPELYISDASTGKLTSNDISISTPKYVRGTPKQIIGDDSLGLLFVLTDEGNTFYVYKYAIDGEGNRVQSSWSKWEVATGTILGLDLVDGSLAALVQEFDGVYLYNMNLNVVLDSTNDVDEAVQYLDRRVGNDVSGFASMTVSGDSEITLPYKIRTDGQDGTVVVVDRDTLVVYEPVEVATWENTITVEGVDLSAANLFVGVLYEFKYVLSRIYWRNLRGEPEVGGHLGLRYIDVYYHDTTDFEFVVSLRGRSQISHPVQLSAVGSGQQRFPILGRNIYATLTLRNFSPGICCFAMLDWEGDFVLRSQRQ